MIHFFKLSIFRLPISRLTYAAFISAYIAILNIVTILKSNAYQPSSLLQYSLTFYLLFFCLINLFSFQKHLLKIVSITALCCVSIIVFFRINYKSVITTEVIEALLTNDIAFMGELFSTKLLGWLALTALLPSFFIIICKFKNWTQWKIIQGIILNTISLCAALILLFLTGILPDQAGAIRPPQRAYFIYSYSPVDIFMAAHEYLRQKTLTNFTDIGLLHKFKLNPAITNLKVIIVIGETARADRFSLNGYPRITNPRLSLRKNLVSFNKMQSCATFTTTSLYFLLDSRSCKPMNKPTKEITLTSIFKNLNFKIHIYSLQVVNDVYKYWGYDILKMKYSIFVNSGHEKLTDELLVPHLTSALTQTGNQLIILHTLGSHYKYMDRYTGNLKYFKNPCLKDDIRSCNKNEIDDVYDNTIVYTDFFLDKIISLLENQNAILFYVSDHGESLGEHGLFLHGAPIEQAPPEQLNVPFITWASSKFLKTKTNRRSFNALIKAKKNAFLSLTHDHFFHTVLGCSGIQDEGKTISDKLNLCSTKNLEYAPNSIEILK